jgi:hypothetical protein
LQCGRQGSRSSDSRASRGYVSGTPEFNKYVEDERQIRLVRRSAGTVY